MKYIGGNITALLQLKNDTINEIGETEYTWSTIQSIVGFLDLASGGTAWQNYNAKIQESSHVFICDYVLIPYEEQEVRLVINNKIYEITLIDNPMELNKHIEIYLNYIGV